ncbi:MAG: hypothetical protein LBQ96_06940 [Fusobacteriaceae bacterium]|jgi:hypothetical protein|nr:hypothetical protein [Fusobacteriaceae bacterium]
MKKYHWFLLSVLFLTACSITPEKAEQRYGDLSHRFDRLVDDQFKEKERKSLEKSFRRLGKRLNHPKKPEDAAIIGSYKRKVNEKIQYLEDLKD